MREGSQPPNVSAPPAVEEEEEERHADSADSLQDRLMSLTAAQESLTDKLERRWGKALADLGDLIEYVDEEFEKATV